MIDAMNPMTTDRSTQPVPLPTTPQELDEAVRLFKTNDWSREELFQRWEAIRLATLNLSGLDTETESGISVDGIPGADSY